MNRTAVFAKGGLLALAALPLAQAQYAPPPPPASFAGFWNEALRRDDPAMSRWDLGGSFRSRYEYRDGYGIAGTPGSLDFRAHGADVENDYLLNRLRFRAGYTDAWWGAMVEGRSSFVFGDARFASTAPVPRQGSGPESDTIDLHQAFVTVGNPKVFPLSAKVGRQELSYGEERLVGAFGWNNIGRVFDAAKLRWQAEAVAVEVFGSRVVIPEDDQFNVSNDYDWFSGVHATFTKLPKHTLETYFFSRNASPEAASAEPSPQFPQPSARDIYTLGARLKSKPGALGPWDCQFEAAGQLGNYRDPRAGAPDERLDHEAYMGVAQAGYTFRQAWAAPRFAVEYAFGSGDRDPQDGRHQTFENLFPTNHKFYGYGDFLSLQNLHNARLILQGRPHPRVSVAVEGHLFWLAETADSFYSVGGVARGGTGATSGNGYGVNPGFDPFVGSEIDVVAGWAVTRFAQLEAGYAHFFHGDYIAQSLAAPSHGARDADFAYLQLNLSY